MSDNDLIRRGDALALPPHDIDGDPAGKWDHHVFVRRDAIAALPAVTVDALSVPEVGSVIRALDSVIAEMHHLRAALRGLEDRG